jgi:hypothetical protein
VTWFRAIAPDPGCADVPAAATADQAALTRTTIGRLVKALRRVKAHRLRGKKGPRLSVKLRSGSSIRANVTRHIRGHRRLLSRGTATATCGRAHIRLKPTSLGRRELRSGRRVAVELRLKIAGSSASSSKFRALHLRR